MPTPTDADRRAAETLWHYHQMGHELVACDVAIGLGSHDLGVAEYAAGLYHEGLFPTLIFSGADNPTMKEKFPKGEAVHFRDRAVELGVPAAAILIEPDATNTGANIINSQRVLHEAGIAPASVLLLSMPYMERRSYATCRKVWPEVTPVCSSEQVPFDAYLKAIGDELLVLDQLVGDTQRVIEYPRLGFAIEQEVPADVRTALDHLINQGYTSRLLT
jgi:uncharacterized SAM-binding protein YcdF (DUF218 family)